MSIKKLCFAFCIVLFSGGCVTDEEPRSYVMPGDTLPYFSVVMDDGDLLTTDSLCGAPSLVMFFTTGCPDCRAALPVVQALHEERPELRVVCISRQEGASEIETYWRDNHLTLPYSAQTDRRVYSLFASSGVPRIYTVGSRLTVTATFDDSSIPTLEQLVNVLYGESI